MNCLYFSTFNNLSHYIIIFEVKLSGFEYHKITPPHKVPTNLLHHTNANTIFYPTPQKKKANT